MKRTDSLYFRIGMTKESLEKMKAIRKQTIALSETIELLGDSRELSLAFTHIEQALSYAIKHICLTDPNSQKEQL